MRAFLCARRALRAAGISAALPVKGRRAPGEDLLCGRRAGPLRECPVPCNFALRFATLSCVLQFCLASCRSLLHASRPNGRVGGSRRGASPTPRPGQWAPADRACPQAGGVCGRYSLAGKRARFSERLDELKIKKRPRAAVFLFRHPICRNNACGHRRMSGKKESPKHKYYNIVTKFEAFFFSIVHFS